MRGVPCPGRPHSPRSREEGEVVDEVCTFYEVSVSRVLAFALAATSGAKVRSPELVSYFRAYARDVKR